MNGEVDWYTALHPDNLLLSTKSCSRKTFGYFIQHKDPRDILPRIHITVSVYTDHYIRGYRRRYLQAQTVLNTLHRLGSTLAFCTSWPNRCYLPPMQSHMAHHMAFARTHKRLCVDCILVYAELCGRGIQFIRSVLAILENLPLNVQ